MSRFFFPTTNALERMRNLTAERGLKLELGRFNRFGESQLMIQICQ